MLTGQWSEPMEEDILTIAETAELMQVSPKTIARWVKDGTCQRTATSGLAAVSCVSLALPFSAGSSQREDGSAHPGRTPLPQILR